MENDDNKLKKFAEIVQRHWIWFGIYAISILFFAYDVVKEISGGPEAATADNIESTILEWGLVFFALVFVQVFTTSIPLPPSKLLSQQDREEKIEVIERAKSEQRRRWMIFSYAFMLVSMLGVVYIFSVGWQPSKGARLNNPHAPLAIFVGCSKDDNARDVKCAEPEKPEAPPQKQNRGKNGKNNIQNAQTAEKVKNKATWVLNIGGYVTNVTNSDENSNKCINNICEVSGGILVPLYVILIALLGGSVSLTRRLPEYQEQASAEYVATEKNPKLSQHKFREYLIFQIVQFLSAPLLAILAYYLVEPNNIVQTVILSFTAGFASETILLMIRGATNKLMPVTDDAVKTGTITGIVTLDSKPEKKVEVLVAASPNLRTITDESGHYVLGNIPVGEHAIKYALLTDKQKESLEKTESVKIEKAQAVVTKNVRFSMSKGENHGGNQGGN